MLQRGRPYRVPGAGEDAISDNLASVNDRLEELTRQLERIAKANVGKSAGAGGADEHIPAGVTDALARLDRRLDQVVHDGRAASQRPEHRASLASPPPPPPSPPRAPAASSRGRADWTAQISERQRTLDDGAPKTATPVAAAGQLPAAQDPGPDLTAVEQQLRQINSRMSSLHQPYEDALSALRSDLAEIGRALTEAMPRHAIEALDADVRALAERLDRTKQAGADGNRLAALEHELEELREALRVLTSAENLVGFEEAVRGLSHKIDQIVATTQPAQDPLALKQLEQAVMSLHGIVSNVASDGALEQLAAEVRGLGTQFELAATGAGTEGFTRLEARIATLMESDRAMQAEVDTSIRALSERFDRMQLSHSDQHALVALEDRIARLSEKLDASDAQHRHLDSIERGLADLLVYLEETRNGGSHGLRAPVPPETPAPAIERPPESPARSPLDLIPDLLEAEVPAAQQPAPPPPAWDSVSQAPAQNSISPASTPPSPPPLTQAPAKAAAPAPEVRPPPAPAPPMPRVRDRTPTPPALTPDTPLEPGSGTPRLKPGSPAARIAASAATLGNARPATVDTGSKSAALAAARTAARAAYLDTPVNVPQTIRSRKGGWFRWPVDWFKWPVKRTSKVDDAPPVQPSPPADDSTADMPLSRGKRLLRFLKTLLIAASVAIIVVGVAQTAFDLLWSERPAAPPPSQVPNSPSPPIKPLRPMPSPEGSLPAAPGAEPGTTGQLPSSPSSFEPSTTVAPKPPRADITGSIDQPPMPPQPPALVGQAPGNSTVDTLPTSIGPGLRVAAAANNPAAEYELGARYAEGRGVRQNLPEALRWLGRAADAGFVPAQFRLANLNEKGEGLKKDLPKARRLYLAAAGKGHAKAMHNLAVLYAEGIDGKPDYKAAAQWFRKAAGYGVTDSQYNLAILYARGIGVPANLAESYKWFALSAANGDPDAAKKRDEVALRLDRQTLTAAKLAVQTFIAEPEPEEATGLRAPPGGWDRTPPAPAKPRRRLPASPAQ